MGYRACSYKTASGRAEWLSRDPIWEKGGLNLYGYVANNPANLVDPEGTDVYITDTSSFFGLHQRVCVDTWDKCCKKKTGKYCISFGANGPGGSSSCGSSNNLSNNKGGGDDLVYPDNLKNTRGIPRISKTTCEEDKKTLKDMKSAIGDTNGEYNIVTNSCRSFSRKFYDAHK